MSFGRQVVKISVKMPSISHASIIFLLKINCIICRFIIITIIIVVVVVVATSYLHFENCI